MLNRLRRLLGFPLAPASSSEYQPVAGHLVSVSTDEGDFAVMKLLATDGGGVHARLYVQRFRTRPSLAEVGKLSLAAFGPGFDNPMSIGHMPMSYATFAAWEPRFLSAQLVEEDELEGYRIWQEADSGYF